jgi:hypothetical protein
LGVSTCLQQLEAGQPVQPRLDYRSSGRRRLLRLVGGYAGVWSTCKALTSLQGRGGNRCPELSIPYPIAHVLAQGQTGEIEGEVLLVAMAPSATARSAAAAAAAPGAGAGGGAAAAAPPGAAAPAGSGAALPSVLGGQWLPAQQMVVEYRRGEGDNPPTHIRGGHRLLPLRRWHSWLQLAFELVSGLRWKASML